MRPASIRTQTSAGGVIFRKSGPHTEVALIAVKGGKVWSLPKGLVDKGEASQDTALREVREETGLRGELVGKIGSISYWYFIKDENVKCRKAVTYYLMRYRGGDIRDHDFEVDESAWFPIEDALQKVTYKGDREILVKALDMIRENERKDS